MKRKRIILVGICLALAAVAALRHHPEKPCRYTVTDLGTLGDVDTEAYAINNLGQIVGQSGDHAFLWTHGEMQRLDTLPNRYYGQNDVDATVAYSINDRSDIIGNSTYGVMAGSDQNLYDAVLWRNGKPISLGELVGYPNSTALKINAHGQVVGQGIDQEDGPTTHIYRSCSARFADGVGIPTGALPNGYTLNDRGQYCGSVAHNRRRVFVLWQEARVLVRTALPAAQHLVDSSLNNRGQAALTLSEWDSGAPDPTGPAEAILWANGVMRRLPALPGYPNAHIKSISDLGQIVGNVVQDDRVMSTRPLTKAVLWEGGDVKDLNTLIPKDSGWRLAAANGINNRGQIVGWGQYGGQIRAFLLTPTGLWQPPKVRQEGTITGSMMFPRRDAGLSHPYLNVSN